MASPDVAPGTPDGSVNSSSLHKEGPVLCFLNKRLRALKKKYNRILQIEESKLKGKVINKEQEEVLHSKVGLAAIIEEYEKLKLPLSNAVKEELAEKERELMASGFRSRDEDGSSTANDKENSYSNCETVEEDNFERNDVLPNECSNEIRRDFQKEGRDESLDSLAIADLLQFMYFSQLFEVKSHEEFASMTWTKIHERTSCLSYDYVTEDATDHLREEDLDALAILGSLMTARSTNATVSHKDALQICLHHARQWLYNSDQPILDGLPVSYSSLRERLNRITSSEYFVMTPELKMFSRQSAAAETMSAAQYSPHVLIHQSSAEDGILQMEGASNYFQHHNQTNTEHRHYVDEESSNRSGSDGFSSGVGVGNISFSRVIDNQCSSESLQNENQIPASSLHDLKQDESHTEQLHSLSQLSQQNVEHDQQQHPQQTFQQRHSSRQQPQQLYAQNGGLLKSNERGGRSMGYGGVGRGRDYMNGRGNRGWRSSSYSEGYGQYYDHGNESPRNYYGRRGRGGRAGGQMQGITVAK